MANLGRGVNEDKEWFGPGQDAELANLGSGVNEDEEWFVVQDRTLNWLTLAVE